MTPSTDIRFVATVALAVFVVASGVAVAEPTTDYDALLDSERTAWQGQTLYFDGAAVVEASAEPGLQRSSEIDRNFTVRALRDDGTLGPAVETVTLDASGRTVIPTAGLDGRYVLVYDGSVVDVDDGDGSLAGDVTTANHTACAWSVTADPDDVTAQFDDTTDDGVVLLQRGTDTRFSGAVDLPTDTEVTVRLSSDGSRPVLFSLQTELGPESRFDERLDLAAVRPGTELDVSVSLDGRTLVTTTAVVGGEMVPAATTSGTPRTATALADESARSPTRTTIPGFDGTTAVVALLVGVTGVSLAAVRRSR
jgi:hypothetical protein